MNIYHYNQQSGALLGSSVAKLDPIDQNPMIPAGATPIEPPAYADGEIPVFDENSDSWSVVVDQRGVEYWDADGKKHVIDEVNVSIPPEVALSAPPSQNHVFEAGVWVESVELVIKSYESVISDYIFQVAQDKGYDSIDSIAKYLGTPNAFQEECQALSAWTAEVWITAQTMLNDWQAGTIQQLTPEQVIAALPVVPEKGVDYGVQ